MKISTLIRSAALSALLVFSAVAATIDGKWTGKVPTRDGGERDATYEFKTDGSTLTGKMSGMRGDQEISDGKVDGDKVSFKVKVTFGDRNIEMMYAGEVSGDDLTLTRKMETPNGPMETKLTAKRAK